MTFTSWIKDVANLVNKESNMAVMNHHSEQIDLLDQLAMRNNSRTPDFLDLKMRGPIPVFVYGTLKSGGRLSKYLENQPFLGEAVTTDCHYKMAVCESDFPIVFKADKRESRVGGEVYMADAKMMLELDIVESNGDMYRRREIGVTLLDQTSQHGPSYRPVIMAFAYFGMNNFWTDPTELRYLPKAYTYKSDPVLSFNQYPKGGKDQRWKEAEDFDDRLPF